MKYSKELYEQNFYPFDGDMDVDVRCETRKIVKTRKIHECFMGGEPHEIKPGTMALRYTSIADGVWDVQYFCVDCLDKWIAEERLDLDMPKAGEG